MEDREFELEKLKIQLKHQAVWSSLTLLIAVEFAVFTSIAATYLSFGLTSGNVFYIFVSASSILILGIMARLTIRYFQSRKIETYLNENVEKEIQSIRDRFITERTEQEQIEEEHIEMSSEDARRRDKLIYEIIVDRFKQEWKRTNDLDSKASSVTGFAGLLITLTAGITAGITEFLPQMHYKNLFVIPLVVFVLSAVSGLAAYWLTSFSAINPDAMIREYADKTETEVIRRFVPTVSILTMDNFQRNQRKVKWLYVAFILLVSAIVLFFAITIVNMMI